MKILIKISGDIIEDKDAMSLVWWLSQAHHTVVIHGMGTQFSKSLDKAKIPYHFNKGNRVTSLEGLKIGLKICKKIRRKLKFLPRLVSPIVESAGLEGISNVNSDELFSRMVPEFDFGIIFTKSGRIRPHIK